MMLMEKLLVRGYRSRNSGGFDLNEVNARSVLVIKLPDSRILRIMSRSLFMAMLLVALPSIGSIMSREISNPSVVESGYDADLDVLGILPVLLRDLVDEGLIKKGHCGLILGGTKFEIDGDLGFLRDAGVDLVTGEMNIVEKEAFDFVFSSSFHRIELTDDRIVKDNGGIVISPLGNDPKNQLRDFEIVYLRKFQKTTTMVVMRKKQGDSAKLSSSARRVLCDVDLEKRNAALKELEDVYLEPPRRSPLANEHPSFTSRKIKFLPDLLKDSLDEYPRRVFISDEASAVDWFRKNYPTKDQEFQVYQMEAAESSWVAKHVRREDYVVMKAEAQLVEEMLKDNSLSLVDELFLECKNQWQNNNGGESKRAYWECLALYGKVRDEGIAVHQWWN